MTKKKDKRKVEREEGEEIYSLQKNSWIIKIFLKWHLTFLFYYSFFFLSKKEKKAPSSIKPLPAPLPPLFFFFISQSRSSSRGSNANPFCSAAGPAAGAVVLGAGAFSVVSAKAPIMRSCSSTSSARSTEKTTTKYTSLVTLFLST